MDEGRYSHPEAKTIKAKRRDKDHDDALGGVKGWRPAPIKGRERCAVGRVPVLRLRRLMPSPPFISAFHSLSLHSPPPSPPLPHCPFPTHLYTMPVLHSFQKRE